MGVSVGPGRGSAAGSAVAYCTGITNVDPIAYDLLFERFLNPERISMPDIDIDFDVNLDQLKFGRHSGARARRRAAVRRGRGGGLGWSQGAQS